MKRAAELAELPRRRVPRAQSAAQPAGDRGRRRVRDPAADRQGRDVRGEARARRSAARVVAGVPDEGRARRCRRSRSRYGMSDRDAARGQRHRTARDRADRARAARADATADGAKRAESLAEAVFTTVPAGRTFYYTRAPRRHADGDRRALRRDGADLRRWNASRRHTCAPASKLRVTSDAPPVRPAGTGEHHRDARRRPARNAAARRAARPNRRRRPRGGKTAATTPADRASANGH